MSGRWLGWVTGLLVRVLFLGLRSRGSLSFSLALELQLQVVSREEVLWRDVFSDSAVDVAVLPLEDSLWEEVAEESDRRRARRKVSRMAIVKKCGGETVVVEEEGEERRKNNRNRRRVGGRLEETGVSEEDLRRDLGRGPEEKPNHDGGNWQRAIGKGQ